MSGVRVRVESIAAGGDGVARANGRVVFIPRSAPGDEGMVEIPPGEARFARAPFAVLAVASPIRVDPPCPHYTHDRCGGCQLQHMAYDAQREAKGRIIADALGRIGRRRVDAPRVRASPAQWRYRRKLTLALRAHGDGWVAGLHPYDDARAVFPVADCPITDARVLAVWADVLAAAALFPRARALRGAVRVDDAGGASFVLSGGRAWPNAEAFFDRVPALSALWWEPDGGEHRRGACAAGSETGGRRPVAARADHPPGASFMQVNPAVAAELGTHVLALVRAHHPAYVVDAYAGLGDTAVALARDGVRVAAIELDTAAAAWCATRLPEGSRSIAGRAEDALPRALPADVVVLNPPRAGVDARVAAALDGAAPAPRAVVYVSCDPATLARDLSRLPSYRIASLTAFDMFPQTAHVETVCELVPEAA